MDLPPGIYIFFSLLFSAFFSGIEIAFISANKLRIALKSSENSAVWRLVKNYQNNPDKFITTTLVGNNLALVFYGIYMGKVLNQVFDSLLKSKIEHFVPYEAVMLVAVTILSTLLVLVVAEFLPKALFRINPLFTLQTFIFPFHICYYILWPFVVFVRFFSTLFWKIISGRSNVEIKPVFTKHDIDHILTETPEIQLEEERNMDTEIFKNALDFSSLKVRDCMKPRTEIVAIDESEGIEALRNLFIESGHSKILIYSDSIDNIVGYVHQGALLHKPKSVSEILIPIIITNESQPVNEVLNSLTKEHKSIALVVDELGGTAGIITVEDIMEEILGEIDDEYDSETLKEVQITPSHYIFSGRHEVEYLNNKYGLQIPEGDYETLGGFIISNSDKIPAKGERLYLEGFEIVILSTDNGRINELELKATLF